MSKKQEPAVQAVKVDARAYPIPEPKGSTVAYASVTIGGMFAVNGIRVMNSEKGMFAAMPSVKDNKGEYRDICFPVTKELRAQLNAAVLEAYNAALEKEEPEKTSVRDQIKEGTKAAKEKPAPAKEKAAKKSEPAL